MLGWIVGAVLALCDGLVWAELGAAMPSAGGSYRYLKEIYGPQSLGRLLSFLFIWQLSFSAPLSIASGCIGLAHYAGYLWPGLERVLAAQHAAPRRAAARDAGSAGRGHAGNLRRHRHLRLRCVPALSADYRHRQAGGAAVGRS